MQVGRHHHVERIGFQHHPGGRGVDQFAVDPHGRKVARHFIKDLVPHHHAEALGVRLGHQGEVAAWSLARQLEGEAVDSLDADTGEHGRLGADLDWQAPVRPPAVSGVLALGVLANDDPVDLAASG